MRDHTHPDDVEWVHNANAAFIRGETRYASLLKQFPDVAEKLFAENEKDAKERRENYKKMANN